MQAACTTSLANSFLNYIEPWLDDDVECPNHVGVADSIIRTESGAEVLKLHGCTLCNEHVFEPCSKLERCPKCDSPRYNADGLPKEIVRYFPLRPRLKVVLCFLLPKIRVRN